MAADTYKLTVRIDYTPGLDTASLKPKSIVPEVKTVTMTGTDFVDDTQDIPTSNTAITEGQIGTLGLVFILNLDSTNYVEIGLTSSYTVKLLAGEFCVFPAAASLFAQANTATVKIQKFLLEL